ncbi:MAG: hypothetical protein F4X76_03750 [Chloroflexi bacterium]|nr:hypothetical protein [Chloroflexota bacterium]
MIARLSLALAAVLLLAACSSTESPPPRSPVADSPTASGPAAPTETAAATPTAAPTVPPTPTTAPSATEGPTAIATATPSGDQLASDGQPLELVTGNAIELMAEWLGAAATDLLVDVAEAVVWPDACLGVAQPGVACAAVLTPGFRVVLRDALGGAHRVHIGGDGVMRWAGEAVVSGTVVAVEGASILLEDLEGDHAIPEGDLVFGDRVSARDAPGARYLVVAGPHELRAGDRVAVGLDPDPNGGPDPLIAWLVVLE